MDQLLLFTFNVDVNVLKERGTDFNGHALFRGFEVALIQERRCENYACYVHANS